MGVLLWVWLSHRNTPASPLQEITQQAVETPAPLPAQVYTNTKYGYTLSYPAEWTLETKKAKKISLQSNSGVTTLTLKVVDNPQRYSPEEYVQTTFNETYNIGRLREAKQENKKSVLVKRVHKKEKVASKAYIVDRSDRLLTLVWEDAIDAEAQTIISSLKLRTPTAKPIADARVQDAAGVNDYTPPTVDISKYKTFSGVDFKNLYYSITLPGTSAITSPPSITGNSAADARIQSLATARGYRLQSSPTVGLSSAGGYPLQAAAASGWAQLQQAAQADGIGLSIISGYRSVADQRSLFINRLAAYGDFSNKQIANGKADAAINQVLITSSIPGYSKHHTGYTIDIQTNGSAFESFGSTTGFAWISANNYYNAKRFGFIPSYPDGAGAQGPNPEAWEYVYVGTSYLKK